jgi:hypothetical protein
MISRSAKTVADSIVVERQIVEDLGDCRCKGLKSTDMFIFLEEDESKDRKTCIHGDAKALKLRHVSPMLDAAQRTFVTVKMLRRLAGGTIRMLSLSADMKICFRLADQMPFWLK